VKILPKIVIIAIIIFGVSIVFYNILTDYSTHQKNAADIAGQKALAVLIDNQCMNCHSLTAKEPFYAFIPGIGHMVKKDIKMGIRNLNMYESLDKLSKGVPVSEAVLTKIEYTTQNNEMPMFRYKMIHWGSAINSKEKKALLSWVTEARSKDYGDNVASMEFKNEPVRPISKVFKTDSAKVALGFDLYNDVRLSANNTISCASCHDFEKGGTDQLPVSIGIFNQEGPINSPTVFNAPFNIAQFWDGRAADLQEQAGFPPLDMKEMGNKSFDEIIERLSGDVELKARFDELYAEGITKNSITDAIAEFEKTLITPNSAFDMYLKGDKNAINEDQKMGYEAFKRVGCTTCHVGEAMGGQSFEYVGLFADYYKDRGTEITSADHGRAKFTNKEEDMYYQKVPVLRNIAITQPYMHDASSKTLMEAVEMMNKYQIKDKLNSDEIMNIVDFLNALNGEYNRKQL
jgi:cytochrome c peroxidase